MSCIIFRVDANSSQGFGHFHRCALLANAYPVTNQIYFISAYPPPQNYLDQLNVATFIQYPRIPISESDDFLLFQNSLQEFSITPSLIYVDSYLLSSRWEGLLNNLFSSSPDSFKISSRPILCSIDDFPHRHHQVDFLLDPNLHDPSTLLDYSRFLSADTKLLSGTDYLIIPSISYSVNLHPSSIIFSFILEVVTNPLCLNLSFHVFLLTLPPFRYCFSC